MIFQVHKLWLIIGPQVRLRGQPARLVGCGRWGGVREKGRRHDTVSSLCIPLTYSDSNPDSAQASGGVQGPRCEFEWKAHLRREYRRSRGRQASAASAERFAGGVIIDSLPAADKRFLSGAETLFGLVANLERERFDMMRTLFLL